MADLSPQPGRYGVAIWFRIARIYGRNLRQTELQLQKFALSPAQFDVLAQVGAADGICQQELAERLLVTQGNVTQVVSRMEERGLVERRRDGRLKRIRLTAAGHALRELAVPAQEALQRAQFAVLSHAEQRVLLRLLRKLERGAGTEQETRGRSRGQVAPERAE